MATCRPCRLTSFAEESWYYGAISYVTARAVLLGYKRNGQFLVRDVVPPNDEYQYMLSVRNAGEIRNYSIALYVDGKCTLKGLTFLSLEAAVDFFADNMLDGIYLVTSDIPWYETPQESSIGPAIQVIVDTPSDEVFQGEDVEETDFCQPMQLQTEVTIEVTPHHILEAQDRQWEANRLESSSTCGQLAPFNQEDYKLAPPTVTYSTFKPFARSPSPDCVSPSPATSLNSSFSTTNSSLLAIWPTRRSFHESRASMSQTDSDSSGEEEDSDTDVVSECPGEDVAVFSGSDEVSESTLAASLPPSCISSMKEWIAGDTDSNVVDLSSVSDSQATPLAVAAQAQVRPSRYVRRSPATATTKDSLSSSAGDISERVTKPTLSGKCSKSESSFLEMHHTLEEKLMLKYPNRQSEQRPGAMLKPIPCEFHYDDKDPFGSSQYLYTPQSKRQSFVFPQNTGAASVRSRPRSPSTSARRSSQKQRPPSACFNDPPEPDTRSRRRSIRKSITSLSSLFNKVFRRRSGNVPSQPAPEVKDAVSHGTTPLRHKMAKEMKSKYSSITRHHWESDSMVVLPAKKNSSLVV